VFLSANFKLKVERTHSKLKGKNNVEKFFKLKVERTHSKLKGKNNVEKFID